GGDVDAFFDQLLRVLEDRRHQQDERQHHQREDEGQEDLARQVAVENPEHDPTRLHPMTRVALLWHMHQPFYEDLVTGEHILPWVRLHALKDYYGKTAILREFPSVKATFNVVPSLLVQLEAFAEDRAHDRALELSLKPAADLTPSDVDFIRANFFHAQRQHMIDV